MVFVCRMGRWDGGKVGWGEGGMGGKIVPRNIIKKAPNSQERLMKILTTPSWSLSCTDSNV